MIAQEGPAMQVLLSKGFWITKGFDATAILAHGSTTNTPCGIMNEADPFDLNGITDKQ